jgi:hypothetical protein
MYRLWLVATCGALILMNGAWACAQPAAGQKTDVKFETVVKGTNSGIRRAETKVVTSDKEWEQFWKQHSSITSPSPAAPKVDFAKQVVVVVMTGEKMTGGYTVEVTRIELKKETATVHYKETKPKETNFTIQVLTQPFHFVRMDRPKGQVKFVAD